MDGRLLLSECDARDTAGRVVRFAVMTQSFRSILFVDAEDGARAATAKAPASFVDLNLDQVIDAITIGKQEYGL